MTARRGRCRCRVPAPTWPLPAGNAPAGPGCSARASPGSGTGRERGGGGSAGGLCRWFLSPPVPAVPPCAASRAPGGLAAAPAPSLSLLGRGGVRRKRPSQSLREPHRFYSFPRVHSGHSRRDTAVRVLRPWNTLPREVVGAPVLAAFKALGSLV